MNLYPVVQMYRDFFGSISLKNSIVVVLFVKLFILWALFHYFYENPYKASPHNAPSAIAEKLKPQ
jgi:hypothetical protein